jgi:hypothetical protein
MQQAAAVGVANHNGWPHLVTVAWSGEAPVVVDRRRVSLVDEALPNQPYHHEAAALPRSEAQALVDEVRRSARANASVVLATLLAELAPACQVTALALRATPFGALPDDVSEVLDYLPFTYIADAMLYLEALNSAGAALGLSVTRHVRGAEFELAAERLATDAAEVEAALKELGRQLGPPWTQEHQRAAAAAIALLPP